MKSDIKQERAMLDDNYGRVNEILGRRAPDRVQPPRRSDVYEATEISLMRKESQATAADVAEPVTELIDETQADETQLSDDETEMSVTETATVPTERKALSMKSEKVRNLISKHNLIQT